MSRDLSLYLADIINSVDRIIVDSSADWGVSDPLAVPKTAQLMAERGIPEAHIKAVCYQNALTAYSQSGQIKESDWLDASPIDQRELFSRNSVLRGQKPLIESNTEEKSFVIV